MKMRKTSTVLTVVAIVLAVLSIGVLLFTPAMLGDRLNNLKDYSGAIIATPAYLTGNILKGELPGIIDVWLGKVGTRGFLSVCLSFFQSGAGQPWLVMRVLGIVSIALPIVILVLHLILVFVRRRPAAFVKTVLYLVFGGVLGILTVSYLSYNYLFNMTDLFGAITANKDMLLTCFVLLLPFALAAAGLIVYTIGMVVSIADVCANPGLAKKTNAAGADSMGHTTPTSEEPLKYEDLTNIEYHQLGAGNPGLGTHGGHGPMIVQYISYAGLPGQQQPAAPAPAPAPEPKPEPKPEPAPAAMTPSYVAQPTVTPIKICDESEYHAEPKPEPKPEPAPEPAKDDADRPITAKELRKIIRDALEDHEHPEENEPLTDGSARKIIQDELAAYYGIEEEDEPAPEPAPAAEPEPAPEPEHRLEDDYDILSADELRDIIRQEIEAAIPAPKEEEEAAPTEPSETDKRLDAIHEELRSLKESYMAPKEEEKAEPAAEEAPEEKEAALTDAPAAKGMTLKKSTVDAGNQAQEEENRLSGGWVTGIVLAAFVILLVVLKKKRSPQNPQTKG